MKQQKKFGLFLVCATLVCLCKVPAFAAPPDVDAKGLPAGWTASKIGTDDTLSEKQSVEVDANGVWTIKAAGRDLWDDADGGIIIYMKHTGDGRSLFRLLSQDRGDGGSDWVKTAAGFRETLDASSRDVHISYSSANSLEPAVRVTAGETPKHPGDDGSGGCGFNGNGSDTAPQAGHQIMNNQPIWIGVDRKGDNFGYFYSDDGVIWTSLGNATIKMPAEMFVGIEATKHNNDSSIPLAVSKLDNVTLDNNLIRTQSIDNLLTKAGTGQVLISWNPPVIQGKDVTFNVYTIDEAGKPVKKLTDKPIKESSFTATGLTKGTDYRFGVTATVDAKESPMQFQCAGEGNANMIPAVTPG